MAAAAKSILLVLALLLTATVAASATTTTSEDEGLARFPGRRRGRNRHGGRTPTPARPSPAPPATPVPVPAPGRVPSPPGILLPCDRPDVPPMMALNGQNATTGGGRTTPTDCLPSPPPPSPPQQPPGQECVAPMASLLSCAGFITGATEETPAPKTDCCVALGAFMNSSSAAMAAGIGDGGLRCLCPFIDGGVNKALPRPVDPVRLMYLPIACGVVLPPQILFMCFTGHTSTHVVTKFSQLWEKE